MAARFQRPRTETEIAEREAAGLWRAQALAKSLGESKQKVTIDAILRIHRTFFEDANPDIAGRLRGAGEDVKKLRYMTPPPGVAVRNRFYEFWHELDVKIASVPQKPAKGTGKKTTKKNLEQWNDRIVDLAAWTQHKMTAIHPFCEGNGRMARLMTNLILYRFGLQPTNIKYEGEDKAHYLEALGAIDLENDFRPLKQLIVSGIYRSYQKLIDAQERAKSAGENRHAK